MDDSWHAPVDIGHPNSPDGVGATAASSSLNSMITDLSEYYQIAILSKSEGEWNEGIFQEIAWSALYSGDLLAHEGSYDLNMDPESSALELLTAWVPEEFYTTRPVPVYDYVGPLPEPSSGLLTLVGLGF